MTADANGVVREMCHSGAIGSGRAEPSGAGASVRLAMAKYDEQVARALAGAHNTARVARGTPDYVRVGAGIGSAFVWALLDLADAIRANAPRGPGGEFLPERRE
jgi:hypothetical protein